MLLDFLKYKRECQHNNVPIDVEEAYCPDCGAYVQNKWFLVRCSCCNIKRSSHSKYNEIIPDAKFCQNCGSTEFYVEELEKVNFIDVHYAVHKKIVVNQEGMTTRQVWIEQEEFQLEEKRLIELRK